MTETFFPIIIDEVIRETSDAVTLSLSPEKEAMTHLHFLPGQYLTLRLNIDGKTFRRAYSLSTSPLDKKWSITVKQVEGGKVSTYLCNQVQKGVKVEALAPMGDFTYHQANEKGKSYYMFAGGSGITPVFSNLKTILQTEAHSNVYLLYGNKNEEAIIFKKELEELAAKYPERFLLKFAVEEVEKKSWLQRVFGANATQEDLIEGMADTRNCILFLDKFRPQHRNVEYFVCGPTPMMNGIEALLLERGVDAQNIRLERFTAEDTKPIAADAPIVSSLTAHLRGEKIVVPIREGQTVLEALLQAGNDPPYSCRTGSCASCIGKCTSGKVKMKANAMLEEKELAEGLVLTCQSIPLTETVEIYY